MLKDEITKHIPINICVFDPVPGMGNFQEERVSIGKNVKNYIGFYAKDERSKGFINVVPKCTSSTDVTIIPVPGRHATLVGNAALDGNSGAQDLKQVGLLVRDMAEKILTEWGVYLNNKLYFSESRIQELVKEIQQNDKKYTDMHNVSYTLLTENDNGERIVSYGDKSETYTKIESKGVHFKKIF
ncbi:hypothetical protein [Enterovibrio nigricans]|nr:hypothetical protein [Enterovibrio nigricans]